MVTKRNPICSIIFTATEAHACQKIMKKLIALDKQLNKCSAAEEKAEQKLLKAIKSGDKKAFKKADKKEKSADKKCDKLEKKRGKLTKKLNACLKKEKK